MTRIGLRVQGYAVLAVLCSLLAAVRSEAAVVNLWTYAPPEGFVDASIDVSPAVADINSDGQPEIVIGTTYGHVVALKRDGKPLWKTFEGRSRGLAMWMRVS